jgi:hypothetical protein
MRKSKGSNLGVVSVPFLRFAGGGVRQVLCRHVLLMICQNIPVSGMKQTNYINVRVQRPEVEPTHQTDVSVIS